MAATATATLWDPFDNTLIATLALPSSLTSASQLASLAFLHSSPTLVGASHGLAPCLVVWDLLTLSIRWSVGVHASCLSPDPARPLFAFVMPTEAVQWGPHSGGLAQPTAVDGAAPAVADLGARAMEIDSPSKQPSRLDRHRQRHQVSNGRGPLENGGGSPATPAATPTADPMDASSSGDEQEESGDRLPNGPAYPLSSSGLANGHLEPVVAGGAADAAGGASPPPVTGDPAAAPHSSEQSGLGPTPNRHTGTRESTASTPSGVGPRGMKLSPPRTRGVVVVVGAHSPEPIHTWALQRAPAAALLFAPPASSLSAVARLSAPSGCSPLLIMTTVCLLIASHADASPAPHATRAACVLPTLDPMLYCHEMHCLMIMRSSPYGLVAVASSHRQEPHAPSIISCCTKQLLDARQVRALSVWSDESYQGGICHFDPQHLPLVCVWGFHLADAHLRFCVFVCIQEILFDKGEAAEAELALPLWIQAVALVACG